MKMTPQNDKHLRQWADSIINNLMNTDFSNPQTLQKILRDSDEILQLQKDGIFHMGPDNTPFLPISDGKWFCTLDENDITIIKPDGEIHTRNCLPENGIIVEPDWKIFAFTRQSFKSKTLVHSFHPGKNEIGYGLNIESPGAFDAFNSQILQKANGRHLIQITSMPGKQGFIPNRKDVVVGHILISKVNYR